MEFGYFTLSDNYYKNNSRTANQFHLDIVEEALYAEEVGMHSAWVGEHHFSTLGVTSCPDMILTYVAAKTSRIRLAPAVNVLPLHHPIRVAEQWATLDLLSGGRVDFASGRGYDKREYLPLNSPYENNTEAFREGLEILKRLWTDPDPVTHKGQFYNFENISITPKPLQNPLPIYVACFSRPTVELSGELGLNLIVAPFGAAIQFGGLAEVAAVHDEAAEKAGNKPGKKICSYFLHFADTPEEDAAARQRQLRYFQECVIDALPQDPKTVPPSYQYFIAMVENLKNMKPEHLNEKSVLLGKPEQIIETVKKVEEAGYDEIIVYPNVGLKPHQQVKDEMQRFMEEVACEFEGSHTAIRAGGAI